MPRISFPLWRGEKKEAGNRARDPKMANNTRGGTYKNRTKKSGIENIGNRRHLGKLQPT